MGRSLNPCLHRQCSHPSPVSWRHSRTFCLRAKRRAMEAATGDHQLKTAGALDESDPRSIRLACSGAHCSAYCEALQDLGATRQASPVLTPLVSACARSGDVAGTRCCLVVKVCSPQRHCREEIAQAARGCAAACLRGQPDSAPNRRHAWPAQHNQIVQRRSACLHEYSWHTPGTHSRSCSCSRSRSLAAPRRPLRTSGRLPQPPRQHQHRHRRQLLSA